MMILEGVPKNITLSSVRKIPESGGIVGVQKLLMVDLFPKLC